MKIVSCVKEVSGRETRYEINSIGNWIEERNVSFEINECDEYALEEALKLKEQHGGEVTVLTLGSERAEKVMRKGLAMGADRGILIQDEEREAASPFIVASALAKVLKQQEFDLILTGTQSDDLGHAQTGVMLAELLDIPHATIVMQIEVDPELRALKALREMESGWFQWLEMPLPALLTIQAGISAIRYPSLKGIMQAKKKEILRVDFGDLGIDGPSLPQLELRSLYAPKQERKAEILEGDIDTVLDQLVDKLKKEAKVL
jgi:electron transfer flavoprotein beta subunit